MQDALLGARVDHLREDAGHDAGRQPVHDLARLAPPRDGDDLRGGQVVLLLAPEDGAAARHELGAAALRFPRRLAANLPLARADLLGERAIDLARLAPFFDHHELGARDARKPVTHAPKLASGARGVHTIGPRHVERNERLAVEGMTDFPHERFDEIMGDEDPAEQVHQEPAERLPWVTRRPPRASKGPRETRAATATTAA